MASRSYFVDLEYGVVLRVRFTNNEQGLTDRFTVQLELYDPATPDDTWNPVVRYDNAHGSAHIDHITPKGVTFLKEPLYMRWPYNAALGRAIDELSRDYPRHIARFRKQQEEVK